MLPRRNNAVVFIDFDDTIATIDAFDDLVARFSRDNLWKKLEQQWVRGDIGSKACLKGQLGGVRINKKQLVNYLAGIPIDPYFKKLARLLKQHKIKMVILSDNFDYFIRRLLRLHGVHGVKLFCNKARMRGDRFIVHFPYEHATCRICAHCKTKNLLANAAPDSIIFYIGDGRSDICPAQAADKVFAKHTLERYFQDHALPYTSFKTLKDVFDYFKRSF
ncbi:MAG: MtnX-like HAD-IB family phosphatase [Candidatus Omnitrophica bacterium]|nr:MtnX-like HAD-IB family phosphatase [Candidatus Omnitrophota bacterium]